MPSRAGHSERIPKEISILGFRPRQTNFTGSVTTIGNNLYVTNPIGSNLFFRLRYYRQKL
jgi:hypothetical protein